VATTLCGWSLIAPSSCAAATARVTLEFVDSVAVATAETVWTIRSVPEAASPTLRPDLGGRGRLLLDRRRDGVLHRADLRHVAAGGARGVGRIGALPGRALHDRVGQLAGHLAASNPACQDSTSTYFTPSQRGHQPADPPGAIAVSDRISLGVIAGQ
jgi:hypothetical protein